MIGSEHGLRNWGYWRQPQKLMLNLVGTLLFLALIILWRILWVFCSFIFLYFYSLYLKEWKNRSKYKTHSSVFCIYIFLNFFFFYNFTWSIIHVWNIRILLCSALLNNSVKCFMVLHCSRQLYHVLCYCQLLHKDLI